MRFIPLLLTLMLLSTIAGAKEIHVSKSGDDSNAGTSASPYKTIQKAADVAVAGDIVIVHEGIYREQVTFGNSGTAASAITVKANGTDNVVVSATEVLNNWQKHEGNIYKHAVDISLEFRKRALFFNSKVMDIARWPNNNDNDPYTVNAEFITGGSGSHITYSGIPDIDWSGGYMWYLGAHSGASWTRAINTATTSRIDFDEVDINKWPFNPHNPTIKRNGHNGIFYLFGALGALDYQREWFYDEATKTVYFQAPSDADPATGTAEYTARENTLVLNGDYIVVDGINAFGGTVLVTGSNCTVKNGTISNCYQGTDELDNINAQTGSASVAVQGSNTLIENNVIEYGSANGVIISACWKGHKNNTVKGNIIRNFNTIGNHVSPVRSGCEGTKVLQNTIYTTGRDGIYVSGINSEIAYNDASDCMKINNDGGVFYTVGNENSKNSSIHHNWFHDSKGPDYADGRCAGIYLDNHSKGWDVHHNVVWSLTWSGIQINWDNWYLKIYNNTIWEVEEGMGRWENGYTLKDVQIMNNVANIVPWIGTEMSNNLIPESVPFADIANHDFRPSNNSPLIDAGKVLAGYTDGYTGTSPDIGAYEYGEDLWVPGAELEAEGKNDIAFVEVAPSFLPSQPIKATIEYSAKEDMQIFLVLSAPDGTWLGNAKQTVAAGSETIELEIALSAELEILDNYNLSCDIRPVGGQYGDAAARENTTINIVSASFTGTPIAIPGIIEAENYDNGGEGVAYHDVEPENKSGEYRIDGVDIGSLGDGNYDIRWIKKDEWLTYTIDVAKTGTYSFTFTTASLEVGGAINLELDGEALSQTIDLPVTGDWGGFETTTVTDIELSEGEHVLKIYVDKADFNLDKIAVEETQVIKQIIPLQKGWNLIGFPYVESQTLETALSSIWDKVEIVKDFDGFYDSAQDPAFNSLDELKWGKGYFIKVSEDCELIW